MQSKWKTDKGNTKQKRKMKHERQAALELYSKKMLEFPIYFILLNCINTMKYVILRDSCACGKKRFFSNMTSAYGNGFKTKSVGEMALW